MDRHALLVLHARAELAFHDLHGEPLYAHALRALAAVSDRVVVGVDGAERDRVRADVARWRLPAQVQVQVRLEEEWWAVVRREPGRGLIVHDVLCPLVDPGFLLTISQRADELPTAAVVGFRPVTDTLKEVVDDRIEKTIDREGLVSITSPVVLPSEVLGEPDPPPVTDFSALVGWLRERCVTELVRAPSLGRRVEHTRDVHLLECLNEVGQRVRAEAGRPASAADDRA